VSLVTKLSPTDRQLMFLKYLIPQPEKEKTLRYVESEIVMWKDA
jgi:hypothetical protein